MYAFDSYKANKCHHYEGGFTKGMIVWTGDTLDWFFIKLVYNPDV